MITYRKSQKAEIDSIKSLLQVNNLPFSDLTESPIDFIVAEKDNKIIGCIGLEIHGSEGFLRSFSVEKEYQNMGIGKELYRMLLEYACQYQIKNLHLLTNTAKEYFERIGFIAENRDKAPENIRLSKEFTTLCPLSSTYMALTDIN
jgi:amino-acid N-acetyltransferase